MATAKQIAARKRFAEMARSGKLATMRKKAARVKNPSSKEKVVPDEFFEKYRTAWGYYAGLREDGVKATIAKNATKEKFSSLPAAVLNQAIADSERKFKAGFKKNPAPKKKVQTKRGGCNPDYLVQIKKGGRWITIGSHGAQVAAEEAAVALNKAGLTAPIRVWG